MNHPAPRRRRHLLLWLLLGLWLSQLAARSPQQSPTALTIHWQAMTPPTAAPGNP